jgi:hypothetical protein
MRHFKTQGISDAWHATISLALLLGFALFLTQKISDALYATTSLALLLGFVLSLYWGNPT